MDDEPVMLIIKNIRAALYEYIAFVRVFPDNSHHDRYTFPCISVNINTEREDRKIRQQYDVTSTIK